MKLGLIADTQHYRNERGELCALTPVVRQLDLWADWFPEMLVCAPLLPGPPPPTHTPYRRLRCTIRPLREAGGHSASAKADVLRRAKEWWPEIRRTIAEVDAVHLRTPCNVALFGILAVRLSRRRRYAMYGGQWRSYPEQPLPSRIQRRLLASPSFGGPVAIYGSWPRQAKHLFTCFSPAFTLAEWEAEQARIEQRLESLDRTKRAPVRLVCVGRLDDNKDQETVVRALSLARRGGIDARLECVGSGPRLQQLVDLSRRLGVEEAVRFCGALAHDQVCEAYRRADFNILASRTEGYPKVLAEGMLHGAVPIASRIGINDQILGGGSRGSTFPFGDAEGLASALGELAGDPDRRAGMIANGRSYCRTVTLEAFRELHRTVLERHWGISLAAAPAEGAAAVPAAGGGPR